MLGKASIEVLQANVAMISKNEEYVGHKDETLTEESNESKTDSDDLSVEQQDTFSFMAKIEEVSSKSSKPMVVNLKLSVLTVVNISLKLNHYVTTMNNWFVT